ncbi:FtsK-like domain-containing protein [Aeoliella mucimassa]|uniref:FtsK-like domain-containing protein n=2 Tax=Aeoliella mucimassa TaxID=2527972 RepID=A0A518ALE9_9BACT|nr:FtsK-like domain-containing protein [Aeoliella mucimassa]
MRELQKDANERQLAEERILLEFETATQSARDEYDRQIEAGDKDYLTTKVEREESHGQYLETLTSDYESTRDETQAEYRQVRQQVEAKHATTVRQTKEDRKQAAWQALAVFDASKNTPRETLEAVQKDLVTRQQQIDQLHADTAELLQMRRLWRDGLGSDYATTGASSDDASADVNEASPEKVDEHIERLRQHVTALQDDRLSQLMEGAMPAGMAFGIWVVLLIAMGFIVGWANCPIWLLGSLVAAGVVAGVGWFVLRKRLNQWAESTYREFLRSSAAARGAIDLAAIAAREKSRRDAEKLLTSRDHELADAETHARKTLADIEEWKDNQLAQAHDTYPTRLAKLKDEYQTATATHKEKHRETMASLAAKLESTKRAAEATRDEALAAAQQRRDADWSAMRDRWFEAVSKLRMQVDAMNRRCERLFPDWNHTDYTTWPKPDEATEAIQFGSATLELAKVKHALSSHTELRPEFSELKLPTMITLREQPSLVATVEGEGKRAAVDLLETIMVRYLTAMPPGKVRFTIFDPVSLGESFSAFMHLADHDEGLIHGRIWSESRDMDEQLARLTAHMETILQKYLRNEYATIHEYNEQAGEVAEPFQVLAIANFPHGFSDSSAKRLLSLATGGPRCGIYVILSHDRRQRLPNDFAIEDLLMPSVHLDWVNDSGKFVWRYPAFERLPLALPQPIEDAPLVQLIKQAGKQAKESIRVEVPFEAVMPELDKRWTQHCGSELAIPIGRAGANRLQYVRLGKGTAQHLLVAGKTGSGKSTFLHALVTSGALHYSPEELQFYLVDFKKGVEFKSYATHRLPHAQVIAIESEREFGLSVLERLDEELRRRGEKFRSAGVQNLADYRDAHPDEAVPRVLLVVDEFQELFVEDDKLAQEAGLLLDRLVRQGRAFGMHVLLGSQTLSGAYSLARSTLGQMAVRVALQCSEADSHLILSDERNQAARFLSRPGEAIYNDQNGLVSANQPFQVVWLPDRQRAHELEEIDHLREEHKLPANEPIVFEGNAPADPLKNLELMQLLEQGSQEGDNASVSTAWLGAAVAIKPPTSVAFLPHGGSNLMVVGQQPVAALGVMTTAVISLAAANPAAQFLVLDGARPEDVGYGIWQQVVDSIGPQAEMVTQRDLPGAITRVADELARRDEVSDEQAPPIFLVIHNATRFRDLRKSEDDFSFSMDRDKPVAPDKQLAEILKNGPQWNIHTIIWCDGYNAVSRLFDRLAMREFEMRVVFQMSAADSSNLIDNPAASRLSPHRALLYNDETGMSEKFRPYGMPEANWLQAAAQRLASRAAVDSSESASS